MRFFSERDILTDSLGQARIRILSTVGHDNKIWTYDMQDSNAWPILEEAEKYSETSYCLVKNNAPPKRRVTKKMRAHALAMYDRMKEALHDEPHIFTKSGRIFWFTQLTIPDSKLTYKTYLKYLRLWFYCGKVPENMLPNWDRCSVSIGIDVESIKQISFQHAKSKVQQRSLAIDLQSPKPKVGRKRTSKPSLITHYSVDLYTVVVFDHYYKKYNPSKGKKQRDAYDEMLEDVFSDIDPMGRKLIWDIARIPSYEQFTTWYRRLYGHEQRQRKILGDKGFETQARAILGDSTSKVPFAGAHAQLDATVWNVDIVSRSKHRALIGCPIVFRIRDTKYGMLLGLAVTLDNASWIGAASAIANCLEDKVEFCKKYKVDIVHAEWPIKGLMSVLEADRGETEGFGPESFIRATGVEVKNLKGGRGDLKGGVESDFRTLQVRMSGQTPGEIIENYKENTGDDWPIQATLDIEQFTALLLLHELERMGETRTTTSLSEEMLAAGIDNSPLSMWNWGVSNAGASLKQFDLEDVQLALMPRKRASVTEHGLYFEGCYYTAKQIVARCWFSKARTKRRWPVDIAYDPRLVDCIYLIDDEARKAYVRCELTDIQQHVAYRGKIWAEVKALQRREQDLNSSDAQHKQQRKTDYKELRKEILIEAANQSLGTEKSNKKSSNSRERIRENRRKEREEYSPTQAFRPLQETAPTEMEIIPFPPPSNSIKPQTSTAASNLLNRFQKLKPTSSGD